MDVLKLLKRHIREVVYGANDGIITTFAVVSSVEGAHLGIKAILVVGFASLFADGFSMASSDYLAGRAEAARRLHEGAEQQLRGVEAASPKLSALFTFVAFVFVGIIPLVPYFFGGLSSSAAFAVSGVATGLALFSVGAVRTRVTGGNAFRAGMEMLLIGGSAAAVAYLVGKLIEQWQ